MILTREEIDGFIGKRADDVLLILNSRIPEKAFTPIAVTPGEDLDLPEDPWRVYILHDPKEFRVIDIVEG